MSPATSEDARKRLARIAGQVASGCNIILFTTGNGSISMRPIKMTAEQKKSLMSRARWKAQERDQVTTDIAATTRIVSLPPTRGPKTYADRKKRSR